MYDCNKSVLVFAPRWFTCALSIVPECFAPLSDDHFLNCGLMPSVACVHRQALSKRSRFVLYRCCTMQYCTPDLKRLWIRIEVNLRPLVVNDWALVLYAQGQIGSLIKRLVLSSQGINSLRSGQKFHNWATIKIHSLALLFLNEKFLFEPRIMDNIKCSRKASGQRWVVPVSENSKLTTKGSSSDMSFPRRAAAISQFSNFSNGRFWNR